MSETMSETKCFRLGSLEKLVSFFGGTLLADEFWGFCSQPIWGPRKLVQSRLVRSQVVPGFASSKAFLQGLKFPESPIFIGHRTPRMYIYIYI